MLPHKLWVIYLGGILGMLGMRTVTGSILEIIKEHPTFEKIVYILVSWMGLKLIIEGSFYFFPHSNLKLFFDFFFWAGALLIFIIGFLSTKWDQKR